MYGISSLIKDFKDFVARFRDTHRLPLSPRTMVKKAVKAAKRDARDWGASRKKESPNSFDIRVSVNDWMDYFQIDSTETAERVAKDITQRLRGDDFALKNTAIVSIRPDSSVRLGDVKVIPSFRNQTSFDDDNIDDEFCNEADVNEENETEKRISNIESDVTPWEELNPNKQVNCARTEYEVETNASQFATPILQTFVMKQNYVDAFLVGGGERYLVNPGSVVGVVRRTEDRVIPDIALPNQAFSAVSQDQGVFFCRKGVWHFRHHGRNATVIATDDHRTSLSSRGEECQLVNGSVMTFAEGIPLTFVTDAR